MQSVEHNSSVSSETQLSEAQCGVQSENCSLSPLSSAWVSVWFEEQGERGEWGVEGGGLGWVHTGAFRDWTLSSGVSGRAGLWD